ncbi:hypothetical protein Y032_0126g1329 [Ancylostoma ceylanicum]|uniref:Fibronectin type-III domain-containing protein n=1 Tax=Ancylostoma ceylanicum TaxID=53326 RepID=A0A016T8J9_9BILA|nr:hypothetical protein Y032_0126g1329 [Ancylostoma ceylanicum]
MPRDMGQPMQKDLLAPSLWKPQSYEVEVPSIQDVTVKNFEYTAIGSELIFSWETIGFESGEHVIYQISIYINNEAPRVFESDKPQVRIMEANRPLAIRLKVVPKIDAYSGLPEEFKVNIAEEVPKYAPKNMSVLAYSPVEVYIYFDPIPTDKILGKPKGCEVYVCETKSSPPICISKLVPPRQNEVFFTELLHGKVYHATAECLTGAGAGPRSPWITFNTLRPSPARKKVKGKTKPTQTTQPRPKDIGVRVNINVREDMTVLTSWEFIMDDGSTFDQEKIKDFQVMLYKKDGKHYKNAGIITKNKDIREIDLGLSPNFLFDVNCYFYAVNVTFSNGRRLFEPSEELCYTMASPSFLMLYAFIAIIFLILAAIASIMVREKRRAQSALKRKYAKRSPAAPKLKLKTGKPKFPDASKQTKGKPMAPISAGSRESSTGSGESIDARNAPPWFSKTKLQDELNPPKTEPPTAPILIGSQESLAGSGESIDARNTPPYYPKTNSKEGLKPSRERPAAPIFIPRPREATKRSVVAPWITRLKSNENWKVMKVKPLVPKSGSHESI